MNCTPLKRLLCFASIITIVLSLLSIYTPAWENEIAIVIKHNDSNYTLNLIKCENDWYVKANDLAKLAEADAKQTSSGVSFYKKSPSVFLHTVPSANCQEYNSSKYVPLQSTSAKIGVRFYLRNNAPHAELLRTPQQLLADIKSVFSDSRLPLNQIVSQGAYIVAENTARLWAMMPFVGSGSIIGAITGKDEHDRYREVMTTMISDGGSMTEFLSSCADMDDNIKKYADILGKAAKLTQKGSALYNFLKSKGVSDNLLNALAYEYNPYEHDLGDFLKSYATVAKAIDVEYFLDLCAYYAAVVDMDESTLLCMQKVFANSSNKHAKKATEAAVDLRFGKGHVAISDIYSGAIGNIIINGIDAALEKKLAGTADNIIGLGTFVFDETLHISDKSDALIYMSICASLQNDLIKYYNTHNDPAYDMRAIAILYLKTTLVAYDYLEFDKSLQNTVKTAKQTITSYLENIFDYAETEYAPNYDNHDFIDYLNETYNDVFNGTSSADSNPSDDTSSENTIPPSPESILKVGDHIYFGSAESDAEADIWQVINIDGDYALIYNMCMYTGEFDASIHAQTTSIGLTRYHTYGSASWEYSDLRSWLNSRENEVTYQDVIFDYSVTGIATLPWDSDNSPSYPNSKGYLNSERFTNEEYWLIQPVTHKNLIPWPESGMDSVMDVDFGNFSDDLSHFYETPYGVATTTDMMFLLNGLEFKEYVLANDMWGYYYPNGKSFAAFWLRDSVNTDFAGFYGYYGTHALTVSGGKASSNQADLKSAIRPACYINTKYISEVSGTGEFDAPYKLTIDPAVSERTVVPFVDSIASTPDNEHIFFGQANGKALSWEIIDKTGDVALLLCDNILDSVSMGHMSSYQYDTSPLKKWCDDFYQSDCFTEDERRSILEQSIGSSSGNYFFILSLSEFESFFPTTVGRERPPLFGNETIYWLRTTSLGSLYVDLSSFEPGKPVCAPNIQTHFSTFGICPAVYVNLSLLPDAPTVNEKDDPNSIPDDNTVIVPNVVGMEQLAGVTLLDDLGLQFQVWWSSYSEVETGQIYIIEQSIAPGVSVSKGTLVRLRISNTKPR